MDRLLVTDVDDTLTGDDEAMATLMERLETTDAKVGFGIATGRTLNEALALMDELEVPVPDVLITAAGSELHYGNAPTCRTAPGSGRFATDGTATRCDRVVSDDSGPRRVSRSRKRNTDFAIDSTPAALRASERSAAALARRASA